MPVPQILRDAGRSCCRGIREGRTSASLSVKGPGGPGVVGGFCRGCGGSAGEVLPVGLRGRTLRKVRIRFSLEKKLHLPNYSIARTGGVQDGNELVGE